MADKDDLRRLVHGAAHYATTNDVSDEEWASIGRATAELGFCVIYADKQGTWHQYEPASPNGRVRSGPPEYQPV